MNYAKWNKCDFVNGKGVRTSLFVTGCSHHCKGCWNKSIWEYETGFKFTKEIAEEIINYIKGNDSIQGLSLLGGEPFDNLELIDFVTRFKEECPNKDVWVWSGYTYEQLIKDKNKTNLLSLCDILVDGRFILELKDLKLEFRGSKNQRIINVKESMNGSQIKFNILN